MQYTNKTTGFTLIEMLIVIPFVLLVIAGLVVAITAVTGESLGTRAQTETAYETQDALNRIEASVLRTTSFPTRVTVLSPQGVLAGDTKIDMVSNTNSDVLLLTMPATDRNPLDQDREILYKTGGTLNPCGDPAVTANPVYPVTYAYFLQEGHLVERVITNTNDSTYTQNKGCTRSSASAVDTWQRGSCSQNASGTACKTTDSILASNVSVFKVAYLQKDGSNVSPLPVAPNPINATGVSIQLTSSKQSGSKEVNIQMSLNAQSANM